MELSKRIQHLPISPTRRYLGLAKEMEAKGKRILRLSIGQPDLMAPELYFQTLHAMPRSRIPYPDAAGILPMRQAQADYYSRYGIDYDPSEILIYDGASQAIENALTAVCDPGDQVLLIEPYYTNYGMLTQHLGIDIAAVTSSIEENYAVPSREAFEKAYTSKVKAILFSNPGNPTGRVYGPREIQTIVDFALDHGLYILSDEVYREFNFSGRPFLSLYDFPEIRDQLILIDSASKKFALCGARIGSIASKNKELLAALMRLSQMRLGVSTTEQKAIAALSALGQEYFDQVRDTYRKRRDFLEKTLEKLDQCTFSKPEGAFYTIVNLPVENASDFVVWLLTDFSWDGYSVLLTPIEDFYWTPGAGRREVRISYCVDEQVLDRAIQILDQGLRAYLRR